MLGRPDRRQRAVAHGQRQIAGLGSRAIPLDERDGVHVALEEPAEHEIRRPDQPEDVEKVVGLLGPGKAPAAVRDRERRRQQPD